MDTSDTLTFEWADEADQAFMSIGSHYDYVAQRWVSGHDHAHFTSDSSPLLFCGADYVTCQGSDEVAR